ncbi:MAG: hypothetical protein ABSH50_22020 [Bryobacteraceae bacterium]|jgi:hypothetical protein
MRKRLVLLALLPLMAGAQAIEDGTYHDPAGVQFAVPPNWTVVGRAPASDGAHTIVLRDATSNVIATVHG